MHIVQHSFILPAPPEKLYTMYLDPVQHAAFSGGGEVTIEARVGAEFSGFGGRISGRIVALTPNRQIVQTWRSFEWKPEDPDSILLLTFEAEGDNSRVELLQAPAPAHLHATLQANWPMRYFDPWRAALLAEPR